MCLHPKSKPMSIYSTASRSPPTVVSPVLEKTISSAVPSTPVLKQERRRRVRFAHAQIVGTTKPIEDHRNIWYFAHELESFKTQARVACQKMRDDGLTSGNAAVSKIYNNADFTTRGFEQRMCKNRQRNKALSLWGTLKAQQRNKDPEFIAMIARKCSYTAAQLAYMEAARDYCHIYNPGATESLSAQIEAFASQAFPIKLKRKSPNSASALAKGDCGTNTDGRNVRIRIN